MIAVILVIHILLAVTLVGIVLIQQSEGGALGIGGGGMSGFMTGRSTASLLTRVTAGLAAAFFVTSITLAILAGHGHVSHSVLNEGPLPTAPASAPKANTIPAAPKPAPKPAAPIAPLAK
ncbi:MAG: preprotein translocase subunit SecG [Stellaceae bacterium]